MLDEEEASAATSLEAFFAHPDTFSHAELAAAQTSIDEEAAASAKSSEAAKRAAKLEYELRIAREDLAEARELLQAANSAETMDGGARTEVGAADGQSTAGADGNVQGDSGAPAKADALAAAPSPAESRRLNAAVRTHLLARGLRQTAVTFEEEARAHLPSAGADDFAGDARLGEPLLAFLRAYTGGGIREELEAAVAAANTTASEALDAKQSAEGAADAAIDAAAVAEARAAEAEARAAEAEATALANAKRAEDADARRVELEQALEASRVEAAAARAAEKAATAVAKAAEAKAAAKAEEERKRAEAEAAAKAEEDRKRAEAEAAAKAEEERKRAEAEAGSNAENEGAMRSPETAPSGSVQDTDIVVGASATDVAEESDEPPMVDVSTLLGSDEDVPEPRSPQLHEPAGEDNVVPASAPTIKHVDASHSEEDEPPVVDLATMLGETASRPRSHDAAAAGTPGRKPNTPANPTRFERFGQWARSKRGQQKEVAQEGGEGGDAARLQPSIKEPGEDGSLTFRERMRAKVAAKLEERRQRK